MILPKPPQPPVNIDDETRQYIEDVYTWQESLIRAVQDALNGLELRTMKRGEPLYLPSATVAELTTQTPQKFRSGLGPDGLYKMVYVLDETGGAQPAVTDGTDFRRLTDRAVIS